MSHLTKSQQIELDQIFRPATINLHPHLLLDWLRSKPSGGIVATPRQALGNILAFYLMEKTERMWCIGQDVYWPFALSREYARPLPTWAVRLVALEDEQRDSITVALAQTFVARVERYAQRDEIVQGGAHAS